MDQYIWWIISGIGSLLVITLSGLLRNLYTVQNKKLEVLETEMKKMKENYLDRFEKVNNHVISSKEEIIDKLHSLELSINAKTAADLVETTAVAVALALKSNTKSKK